MKSNQVTPTELDGYQTIKNRAYESHRTGQLDEATRLYRALLASNPADVEIHVNLGRIARIKGKNLDALKHFHQACEFSQWSHPAIGQYFVQALRQTLSNLDPDTQRARWQNYLERRHAAADNFGRRISVLIPETPNGIEPFLLKLATQQESPAEILVAEPMDSSSASRFPAITRIPCDSESSLYDRINKLASQARGDWLVVLFSGDQLGNDHLNKLVGAMTASDGWGCCAGITLPEAFTTLGFEILRGTAPLLSGGGLIVSNTLHQRIGGYAVASDEPLLDYYLKLLWEAEPERIHIGESTLVARSADPLAKKMAIASYLRRAINHSTPPNPFAPSYFNWGLSFYRFALSNDFALSNEEFPRLIEHIELSLSPPTRREIIPIPGVNIVGSALSESGLGENLRAFTRIAIAGNIPHRIVNKNLNISRKRDFSLLDRLEEEATHPCSIFFFNPDLADIYAESLDRFVFQQDPVSFAHYKIGYWFWELERFPPEWEHTIARIDEVWTASDFVARSIASVSGKPVTKIPISVAFEISGNYSRSHFSLPEDRFLFLFTFSFASYATRKNPEGLVKAFKQAFPDRATPVTLVLKAIHGNLQPEPLARLMAEIDNDPRILFLDRYMDRDATYGLQSLCDCYVSLHRSEGFGIGMAESMFLGKPVIATGYSGNLEFMTEENSGLVRHEMVPVSPGDYFLCNKPGYFWADPDLEHASWLMARVFRDKDFREQMGARGQRDLRAKFSHAAVAERVRRRLNELRLL